MNILGFNCYGHDSAAALVVDGEVVFAVEEERMNRKKLEAHRPARCLTVSFLLNLCRRSPLCTRRSSLISTLSSSIST